MCPSAYPSASRGPCQPSQRPVTDAHVLVVQLGGTVAVEAQTAVLAVLASRVVLAADAGHHVEEVDVAAAVGVAVALAVWAGRAWETQWVSEQRETVPACCPSPVRPGKQEQREEGPAQGHAGVGPGTGRCPGPPNTSVQLGKRRACQL